MPNKGVGKKNRRNVLTQQHLEQNMHASAKHFLPLLLLSISFTAKATIAHGMSSSPEENLLFLLFLLSVLVGIISVLIAPLAYHSLIRSGNTYTNAAGWLLLMVTCAITLASLALPSILVFFALFGLNVLTVYRVRKAMKHKQNHFS